VTVSLLEILAAARAHVAPLAAESAGYLLLAVTDHVASAPRAVTADEVELMPDGSVRLRARRGVMGDGDAEQVLRQLLARTLEVASSVGPALRRAAQRRQDTGLPALVHELETALIPVNRAAAKRALARLHRETERAKSMGKLAPPLDAEATPVVAAPVAAAPTVMAPTLATPAVAVPAVAAPVAALPAVAVPVVQPEAEPVAWLAELPELSPPVLPVVRAALPPLVAATAARAPQEVASPPPELTPEPRLAVGEPAFTKPEPVVQRARERGNSTPRLGTLVTLQTWPGEESERTERAPAVAPEEELLDLSIDVDVDVELELEEPALAADAAVAPQPFVDPEPSCLPDVLTAMLELHTGVDADEAPTRIRDVITELRLSPVALAPAPVSVTPAPAPVVVTPAPSWAESVTPTPLMVAIAAPVHDRAAVATPVPAAVATPVPVAVATPVPAAVATPVPVAVVTPVPVAVASPVPVAVAALAPVPTPRPELVDDEWLTPSSLAGIESAPRIFESERVDPALHEALTWDPGPVVPAPKPAPPPPALTIAAPLPEPSPYAPAVLPSRTSEVSDLLDSFYVSDAAEERDLRSALKGMADLELTPMPHPCVEEG
jgi:hypothetical protein